MLLGCVLALAACGEGKISAESDGQWINEQNIVNGVASQDAAVMGLADSKGFVFCTGTLVDPIHVVTAAHCLYSQGKPRMPSYVFLCAERANASASCYKPVKFAVAHPGYRPTTKAEDSVGDIGVVTLQQALNIRPVKLPMGPVNPSVVATKPVIRIVGNGRIQRGVTTGSGSRKTTLVQLTKVTSRLLWYDRSRTPTCDGDSGGAWFYPPNSTDPALVGVHVLGNCVDFGGATMVGAYLDFLRQAGVQMRHQ
jgi:secreted trypsin-like serine protease